MQQLLQIQICISDILLTNMQNAYAVLLFDRCDILKAQANNILTEDQLYD